MGAMYPRYSLEADFLEVIDIRLRNLRPIRKPWLKIAFRTLGILRVSGERLTYTNNRLFLEWPRRAKSFGKIPNARCDFLLKFSRAAQYACRHPIS